MTMSAPPTPPKKTDDVVLVHGKTDDGAGLRVIRAKNGELGVGEVRPLKEGQPLGQGEVVSLKPRRDLPLLCDVTVLHEGQKPSLPPSAGQKGPPKVSTAIYRDNWERIFGKAKASETTLN